MRYKPTRQTIEIGLDSMIVRIITETDNEKREEELKKMKTAISIFEKHNYDVREYWDIYQELKDNFSDYKEIIQK